MKRKQGLGKGKLEEGCRVWEKEFEGEVRSGKKKFEEEEYIEERKFCYCLTIKCSVIIFGVIGTFAKRIILLVFNYSFIYSQTFAC